MQVRDNKTVYGDEEMQQAGAALMQQLQSAGQLAGTVIGLSGQLGAGKSTFCRGFINAAGHCGPVKSPTYTLIEKYSTPVGVICHLDLYRLEDAGELEFIGFRDLLGDSTLLIEWPEQVESVARLATIDVDIEFIDASSRQVLISY